ncbi:MAG: DUF3037 domain-containing protein [Flavipsychrobacter sp.]
MQKDLFEYAVIRVVPRVEREEFMNVGVVLYCAKQRFLQVLFHLDEDRLQAFSPDLDINEVNAYLCAFQHICNGSISGGRIARLPIAERFRWLTATRSTVVQTSRVHPGFCSDPAEALQRLYMQMVL